MADHVTKPVGVQRRLRVVYDDANKKHMICSHHHTRVPDCCQALSLAAVILGRSCCSCGRMSTSRPRRGVSDRTMWRERYEEGAVGLRTGGAGRRVGHGVPLQVSAGDVCPNTYHLST
jgi:hypothetical protein